MLFASRNWRQFPLAVELEIEMLLLALALLFIVDLGGCHGSRGTVLFFLHFV